MTTYTVTTELITPWWLKLLRFFRIKKKREEFELTFANPWFDVGAIILTGSGKILIVEKL